MSNQPLSPREPLPTAFTMALGERIRTARVEHDLSQKQLAERISRRQAAVSEMENGEMQPDATTLVMLCNVLSKPLAYFFPPPWGPKTLRTELTYDEQALLLEFRRLPSDERRKIAINQVAALASLDQNDR